MPTMPTTNMDSYQLKWHSHTSHLNGSVAALYRSERFTDVVLCTIDGYQIPAHRFVLSSCSIYMNALLEGQRSAQRYGNSIVYVVLPPEINTKALQVLIEYMYKGETTVSNDILDIVLQAGDLLKVRGLWRQNDVQNETTSSGDDATTSTSSKKQPQQVDTVAKQTVVVRKPSEVSIAVDQQQQQQIVAPVQLQQQQPKISVKRDEKLLKSFAPVQHLNIGRQSFVGPPKLVFIKSQDGNPTLGALVPKPTATAPQTIVVTPDLQHGICTLDDKHHQDPDGRVTTVRVKKCDRKYAKKAKADATAATNAPVKQDPHRSKENKATAAVVPHDSPKGDHEFTNISMKAEPEWEDECEVNQDEIFETDVLIKPELEDMISEAMDDEDIDEQIYSPLTCELCSEVFHVPAEWVRHIQGHAESATAPTTRKRKSRSSSDDTEETALLRCDLCQKHFPNPGEWVRHIQSTHTETELAISNNSAPPRRHNRFIDGDQNKTCDHCKKVFPSHASMVIHLRTHTGERPFICGLCNKGFNVKSNLLRHLRTLHDTILGPGNIPLFQDDLIITTGHQQQQQQQQPSTSSEQKLEAPS